jgi:mediator of RNA polymerase II transcription subunit 13, fungi type
MEFLKSCTTNAQAIVRYSPPPTSCPCAARCCTDRPQSDFEAVAYHAVTIRRKPSPPLTTIPDRHPLDDLRAAEARLRQDQKLVVQDASRPWLWLFRATTVDQVGQPPQPLPTLDAYELRGK